MDKSERTAESSSGGTTVNWTTSLPTPETLRELAFDIVVFGDPIPLHILADAWDADLEKVKALEQRTTALKKALIKIATQGHQRGMQATQRFARAAAQEDEELE